jgi:hypothetical protein
MTVKAYIPANSTSRFGPGQKAIVMFSIFSCRFIATLLFTDRPMPPRFIYPEKPFLGPGAYLGHVAGLGYSLDDETQWTTGLPAEFYHAFSYPGVFFGDRRTRSIFSVLKLFEYLGIFPAWQMFLALYYWSSFSEGHLAAILSTMIPLVVLIIALDRIVRYTRYWRIVIN